IGLDAGEAEIDHAPHGKGDRKGGVRRDEKSKKGRAQHLLVAQEVRLEREERAKRDAPPLFSLRALRKGPVVAVLAVRL
ncbi:MAG TPA: hypothetical protein DCL72_02570, partial [Rhizobiales bacterium]|nr:hypothetical protein [Hyphomicrobiales bacterium]